MPELLNRRKTDLLTQFEALPGELRHWINVSQRNLPFEKHHSQIDALSKQMLALNDRVKDDWNSSDDFTAIERARLRCAAVQTIWNYFREKLLLRLDERLGRYLKAADAYAWACYEPMVLAQRKNNPAAPYREPPLVTFHSELSPWALSRQSRYDTERDSTGTGAESAFEQVRNALPIPVIGVPWQSSQFLPNLAILAHETGHIVEADFGLKDPVEKEIATAVKNSELADGWSKYWRKEIFADMFACYAAGPSFVWTLADSLPESPASVAIRKRPSGLGDDKWGKYPTSTLRILLNTCALRKLGFNDDAQKIEKYWKGDYTSHPMSGFEGDLEPVVEAVYRAAGLPADLNFTSLAAQQNFAKLSIQASSTSPLPVTETYDPRGLVSLACSFHRDAMDQPSKESAWTRFQNHIVDSRPPGLLDRQEERAARFSPANTKTLADLIFSDLGDI